MSEAKKTLGEELVRLRQEKGVGLEDMARATKIRASLLRALESDKFDTLPPPVFVVGYLQAVARHLGADPAPLVRRYRQVADMGGAEKAEPVRESGPEKAAPRHSGRLWGAVALVALALAGAGLYWAFRVSRTAPALEAPSVSPPPQMTVEAPKEEQSPMGEAGSPAEGPAGPQEAPGLATEHLAGQAAAQSEQTPVPSPAEAPGGLAAPGQSTSESASSGDLVLDFSAPCWTELWRGNERILRRQVQAGERLSFPGDSFRVTLGDASAVRATFKGHAVPLPAGPQRVVKDLAIPGAGGPPGGAP